MIAVERTAYGQDFWKGEPDDLSKLKLHAPFFRFPGFADTVDLRDWFAANNVAIFGVDLWASDWIKMTPDQELKLILSRLERRRRACCCFTTITPWTAEMPPRSWPTEEARLPRRSHRTRPWPRSDGGSARGLDLRDRRDDRFGEAAVRQGGCQAQGADRSEAGAAGVRRVCSVRVGQGLFCRFFWGVDSLLSARGFGVDLGRRRASGDCKRGPAHIGANLRGKRLRAAPRALWGPREAACRAGPAGSIGLLERGDQSAPLGRAAVHFRLSRSRALARMSSLRMMATRATFASFPALIMASYLTLYSGWCVMALRAAI